MGGEVIRVRGSLNEISAFYKRDPKERSSFFPPSEDAIGNLEESPYPTMLAP